jgi:protein gp37
MDYQNHEYADLFPMMSEDEFKSLSQGIVNLGFDKTQPIILFDGKILDGRNRHKACKETGTAPLFSTFDGTKEEALQYVITRNLNRRSLTSEQRGVISARADKITDVFKQQAEEARLANLKQNQATPSGNLLPLDTPQKSQKEKDQSRSTQKRAKAFGTNRENVRKADKIEEYAPELNDKVLNGEVKLNDAYKVVQKIEKEEKQVQKEIAQEAPAIQQALSGDPVIDNAVKQAVFEVETGIKEVTPIDVKQSEEVPLFELKAPEPVKQGNETFTDDKGRVLHIVHSDNKQSKFNETNESIDWAWWSWNPITGCNHGCPYCYARDIATSSKMSAIYPFGFEPTFLPHRLIAPKNTKPFSPDMIRAKANQRNLPLEYANQFAKNVFVCSMADLFGDWTPTDWIKQVFEQVTTYTQWNYLFLTKFPQRLKSIQDELLSGKFPDNCWVGTTVDEQKRVKIAQKAFEGINAKVKWLSLEPLLTNLEFDNLGMFDMVAIGGQSGNSQCKATQPEWEWVENIIYQAHQSKTMVYFKENLTVRPKKLPIN